MNTTDDPPPVSSLRSASFLHSLPEIQNARAASTNVKRPEGSNLDIYTDPKTGQRVALCQLTAVLPYWLSFSGRHLRVSFDDTASYALAAHHLNTGNGSLVPAIEGLNETCPIRFTIDAHDTGYLHHTALQRVMDATQKQAGVDVLPCAFLGAYLSKTSIPMSILTGVLGYPQVSHASSSSDLDDKNFHPLFGRTIPSDAGHTVPIVMFLRDFFKLEHLAVINTNDAYGNVFVDGLRKAAAVHAPNLDIHQVPFDADTTLTGGFVEDVVASVKKSGYRFVFVLVTARHNQDRLMIEAVRQGIAGNGLHTWLFGSGFEALEGQVYEEGSPLYKAYRGSSYIKVLAGTPGLASYDAFVEAHAQLRNEADLAYLDELFPTQYDKNGSAVVPYFRHDPNFLLTVGRVGAYAYESVVSLGLAACDAVDRETLELKGTDHFAAFARQSFTSVSGHVSFDNVTGTRDPSGALYGVINYVNNPKNPEKSTFVPVMTHMYQGGTWATLADYVFNDGTTVVPPEVAPAPDQVPVLLLVGVVSAILFLLLAVLYAIIREQKRKSNDSVWKVKKEELQFGDPPEVLGHGTFGLVLLAEYRGTQVAVKRVIPTKLNERPDKNTASMFDYGVNKRKQSLDATNHSTGSSDPSTSILDGLTSSGLASGTGASIRSGVASGGVIQTRSSYTGAISKAAQHKMKKEFIEEMRHLSRLRHPCVTTVMGAMIEKSEDPMLVMELMDHGSLYDLLHNETMAFGEISLPILQDVSQGMRFLHSADPQVLHGDLKAANVLVDKRFRAKVADFGLSQKKNLGGSGTPFWMAPELLRKESTNTSATDVFSFGVILYEVFSRKDPYPGESVREVLRLVADKKVQKRVATPLRISDEIKTLMKDCMREDPNQRPSFREIDDRLKRLDEENLAQSSMVGANKKKSHVSLFDIFPRHVAEALRDGRKVEAEHKDIVTIFFSDIVGFTNISATLDPRKVANMLDRLYHKFDDLSTQHDIYKVETIGDAFMAVANLVKDQPDDHCKRIAEFSIAAIRAANETLVDEDDPSKGYVNIRVGFHSGSVVADVVGNRNPRYCLFGDAVNTASRMESNSEKNRINCSNSAADVLRQQWPSLTLTSRGKLNIKGKGPMICYWVGGGSATIADEEDDGGSNIFHPENSNLVETDIPTPPIVLPEQHPTATPREVEYAGDMASSRWEEGLSAVDIHELEDNLKDRLSRFAKPN